jgi:hypothetical protein
MVEISGMSPVAEASLRGNNVNGNTIAGCENVKGIKRIY